MKKNLYLLGVLVALLLGTYVFQELRSNKVFEESLTKDHLVKMDDLKSLSWANVNAVKKDEQWWDGDKLLSHNILTQIEKRIVQLKKIKSIQGNKAELLAAPTEFKVNGETWLVGEMTLDKSGFYFARGNDLMIAVMEGEGQEYAAQGTNPQEEKLRDLKKIFAYTQEQLAENQLFRYYPKLPSGTVTVEVDARPGYELDFLNNATLPPPIAGILVHESLLEKFTSILTQITIKKEVPYSENLKSSKVGQMVFRRENRMVTWELWLNSNKSADSYIIDSERKKAWLMIGGTLKGFFIQVQDYWDKKVIPHTLFKNFTQMNVTFTQNDKSAEVEVSNREPLGFKTPKFKIDSVKMNILFQYAFNLSDKDQADRVSQLSKSERKEILSGSHLRLEVMDQDLIFWRKAQELIVVNLTQGFKAHFVIQDESFRATFEDVLK